VNRGLTSWNKLILIALDTFVCTLVLDPTATHGCISPRISLNSTYLTLILGIRCRLGGFERRSQARQSTTYGAEDQRPPLCLCSRLATMHLRHEGASRSTDVFQAIDESHDVMALPKLTRASTVLGQQSQRAALSALQALDKFTSFRQKERSLS
jgi:hypothetical protein